MKVKLKMIVQDPRSQADDTVEGYVIEQAPVMLDGPVSERLAVVDLDRKTGELHPGARFVPPGAGRARGGYQLETDGPKPLTSANNEDPSDIFDPHFQQVSVFATVMRTLQMFERPDNLGRPVEWAFDAPQLLIVPRAGQQANAKYERETHSLQFFSFPSELAGREGERVYTCLSHDIVAHETGHAILDAIAPGLYDAATPESIALHEAIADLVGVVMAFSSTPLRLRVLEKTGGSIEDATEFSWMAEELGHAKSQGRKDYLRNLLNDKTFDPADTTTDELGGPNLVTGRQPHLVSQVLAGALYRLVIEIHEARKKQEIDETGKSEFEVSGHSLFVAVSRFARIVFRCLDYLPPGEVTFADYGRALLASDQASYPDDPEQRDWVREEFIRRHIVADAAELDVETDFEHHAVSAIDLEAVRDSDWAAYGFADDNRELLAIPTGVPIRVLPRLDAKKFYYHRGTDSEVRELIFKVAWDRVEAQPDGKPALVVPAGTTLAIDWQTKRVRALLVSDAAADGDGNERQRAARTAQVLALAGDFDVSVPGTYTTTDGVRIVSTGDAMRVSGSARMLHAAPPTAAPAATTRPAKVTPTPPPGVDCGAFYNLIDNR